jgi:hypothetical protein
MRHSDDKDPEVAELEALLRSMRLAGPSYGHEDRMSEIFQLLLTLFYLFHYLEAGLRPCF